MRGDRESLKFEVRSLSASDFRLQTSNFLTSPGAGEVAPAVDRDRLPRHPSRTIGREKQNQVSHFGGVARTANRMRGLRSLEERGVLRLVHPRAPVQIGDGHAR